MVNPAGKGGYRDVVTSPYRVALEFSFAATFAAAA